MRSRVDPTSVVRAIAAVARSPFVSTTGIPTLVAMGLAAFSLLLASVAARQGRRCWFLISGPPVQGVLGR